MADMFSQLQRQLSGCKSYSIIFLEGQELVLGAEYLTVYM